VESALELSSTPQLSAFRFRNAEIRAVGEGERVWFVAKDVCKALEISWSGRTLDSIKDEWKGMMDFITPRGTQSLTVISEPAVYKLAFRSRKPEAEAFTDWVASEVLPALRRTGIYSMRQPVALEPLIESMLEQEERLRAMEVWRENAPVSVDAPKVARLRLMIQAYGRALGGGRSGYARAYRRFYDRFGLAKYDHLPLHRYHEAVEVLGAWHREASRQLVAATADDHTSTAETDEGRARRLGRYVKARRLYLGIKRPEFCSELQRLGKRLTEDHLAKLEGGHRSLARASFELREAIRTILKIDPQTWYCDTGLYVTNEKGSGGRTP
jgi:prophage antirepressor-like protein